MKRHAKNLQEKERTHTVRQLLSRFIPGGGHGTFMVVSGTSGAQYVVHEHLDGFRCYPYHPDGKCFNQYNPGRACTHILAVLDWRERNGVETGRLLSFWETEEDALRQHRPRTELESGLWATSRKVGT